MQGLDDLFYNLRQDIFTFSVVVEFSSLSGQYNKVNTATTSGHILQVQWYPSVDFMGRRKNTAPCERKSMQISCACARTNLKVVVTEGHRRKSVITHRLDFAGFFPWFLGQEFCRIVGHFWFFHLDLAQHRRKIPILKVLPKMQWRLAFILCHGTSGSAVYGNPGKDMVACPKVVG